MATHRNAEPRRPRGLGAAASLTLAVLLIATVGGCDSNSGDGGGENCSIAYGSPSDTYARFVNRLNVHIDVEYHDRPLSGTINRQSCDLFGVSPGGEQFLVRRCASGDFDGEGFPVACGSSGPARSVSVSPEAGETETVTVDEGFFE